MSSKNLLGSRLKVAIIGAGPAGLGAAIEFAQLPFVDWNLYEQATSIQEIGAGISIQPSTWKRLEALGAAKNPKPEDYYRPADHHAVQHQWGLRIVSLIFEAEYFMIRNGRTGELLVSHAQAGIPEERLHARTHRAKLQLALLKEVDESHFRLSSRLLQVTQQSSGRLFLEFENGFKDEVDLLIGADGVRSAVKRFAYPKHRISYIRRISYRTVITSEEIATVPPFPGVENAITFWHGPNSWLYTCPLGNNQFEITTNTLEPAFAKEKVSWGEEATIEENLKHFEDFAPVLKAILKLPKQIKQYALFTGPRLDSVYSVLDRYKEADKYLKTTSLNFDEAVNALVELKWSNKERWIAEYDIEKAFNDAIEKASTSVRL